MHSKLSIFSKGTILMLGGYGAVKMMGSRVDHTNQKTFNQTLMEKNNERRLNFWQKKSLSDFASRGLTADMLLTRNKNGHEFGENHERALHFLVVNEVAVTHGLERLDGLSSTQAIGIQLGLKRDDVIKLTNLSHMKALAWLASHGLTAEMLLTRNDNRHVFTWHYAWALRNLVEERHFTVVQALKEIDGLNADQVRGINEGLTRDDVINLTNVWHISVLTKLASHGLTAEMLLTHNDNGHEFNEQHARALMNLVKDRNFTVIQALEEIDGLNSDEAIDIKEGLTRGDVIHSNSVFRR